MKSGLPPQGRNDQRPLHCQDLPEFGNKRRLFLFVLIMGVSLGLYAFPPHEPTVEVVVDRVIDGDTLEASLSRVLAGQLSPNWHSPVKVRLIGIDCPEMDTPLGPKAKSFLATLVDGKYL